MAKTYNTLTVANATAGNAILASDAAKVFENVNNYRVPPMVQLRRTTAQSIPNNTGTLVTWEQQAFTNTDGMWTSGAEITCPTAGVYSVNAAVLWQGGTQGIRRINIQKNNAGTYGGGGGIIWEINNDATPISVMSLQINALISLAANDTVSIGVLQNQGSAINVNHNAVANQTWVSLAWLGQVS